MEEIENKKIEIQKQKPASGVLCKGIWTKKRVRTEKR